MGTVAMWAAISACDRSEASQETATRSSASPTLATLTYVLCWSSVPTMCSVRMGEIPSYDSGVCTWPRAEASSPANRAIVVVARKLAALLHRIWITQEPYIPFYGVAV